MANYHFSSYSAKLEFSHWAHLSADEDREMYSISLPRRRRYGFGENLAASASVLYLGYLI